jgi:hypothetical protein
MCLSVACPVASNAERILLDVPKKALGQKSEVRRYVLERRAADRRTKR